MCVVCVCGVCVVCMWYVCSGVCFVWCVCVLCVFCVCMYVVVCGVCVVIVVCAYGVCVLCVLVVFVWCMLCVMCCVCFVCCVCVIDWLVEFVMVSENCKAGHTLTIKTTAKCCIFNVGFITVGSRFVQHINQGESSLPLYAISRSISFNPNQNQTCERPTMPGYINLARFLST